MTPNTRTGLKLLALLYPRPGELRFAEWNEFDLSRAVWTIPASRTKMRRKHTKPLSPMVVEILQAQKSDFGSDGLVLASMRGRHKPMSENTFNQALRRLGFSKEQHTAHGFRASAASLLGESGKWNPDAVEAELAHRTSSSVRNAYHRTEYWNERVRMADWWAGEIVRLISAPPSP